MIIIKIISIIIIIIIIIISLFFICLLLLLLLFVYLLILLILLLFCTIYFILFILLYSICLMLLLLIYLYCIITISLRSSWVTLQSNKDGFTLFTFSCYQNIISVYCTEFRQLILRNSAKPSNAGVWKLKKNTNDKKRFW